MNSYPSFTRTERLKDLASARKLYVRLDLFGAPAQTMAFDLGDVKGVMKWLDEADAVRS